LDSIKKNPKGGKLPSLDELKKDYVKYLLQLTDNDIGEAAEILDVRKTSLQKKKKK
jgi:transcriptional regulator with PAS, ATPase and Fis domain